MDTSQQSSDAEPLDEILAEYLQALESGQSPDRQALLDQYPEFSDELSEFFADHDHFEFAVRPLIPTAAGLCAASTARTSADVNPPPPIVRYFGDYELLAELGRGGMGVVYKARQVSLNRMVALKMILNGVFAGDREVRRFHTEAESAANLDHPNIVPIYEVGEHGHRHYFTMKLIQGPSLARQVQTLGQDLRQSAQLMATVSRAVHHAHQRGVLHRDLKPANILLDEKGTPYVTDFGLAKLANEDITVTQTGMMLGTPSYMPPEQARGEEITTAADVYGLGATLYELICGHPPFRGETPLATVDMVRDKEPARPNSFNKQVDRDLETICLKCLEKEPPRRYDSTLALAEDLERWLRGEPIQARLSTSWQRVKKLLRRHPAMSALIATVAALAIAIATISTIAAIRLSDRGKSLQAAQADAREKLRGAYLAQAQAGRFSGRAGRRFDSLDAIKKATEIRPGIDLRNEAIACMALVDIRPVRSWQFSHRIAFDTDMKRYAICDDGGPELFVKELASDRIVATLPTNGMSAQEFSPDGAFLLVTDLKGGAQVWDLKQARIIWPPPVPATPANNPINLAQVIWCRFTLAGACLMYGAQDQLLHFYDLQTNQERTIPLSVRDAHINQSGDKLLTCSNNDVRIYSTLNGSLLAVLPHQQGVAAAAWHPDGKRIAISTAPAVSDFAIHYWDLETQKELPGWSGHDADVVGLAFGQSGRLLISTSWDNTTRIWDSQTHKELVNIDAAGNSLCFSKNGDRFSFRHWNNEGFQVFDVATASVLRTLHGHHSGKGPYATSFHPGGRVLATIARDAVRMWDTETGDQIAVLPIVFDDPYQFLLFSADGKGLYSNGWKRSISFGGSPEDIELQIGAAQAMARPLPQSIMGLQAYQIAVVAGYPQVNVNENGPMIIRLDDPGVQNGTRRIMPHSLLSPSGEWIATFESDTVTIWDARTSKPLRVFPGAGEPHAFSPDGKWLLVVGQHDVAVLDVASGRLTPLFPRRTGGGWSADSSMLAVPLSPRTVQLLDTRTWTTIASLESPDKKPLVRVEFSPDGTQLVVASEANLVDVWDLSLIRRQLRDLGLDWDLPPLPVRDPHPHPLRVTLMPAPSTTHP